MKYIDGPIPIVELTRRNLETLLAKLDDPNSRCTIADGEGNVFVKAVENDEHYIGRAPGLMLIKGEFQ